GDGGDELFGGYTGWYMPIYFMLQKYPLKISRVLKDILKIIFTNSKNSRLDLYYRLQGFWNKFKNINPLQAHINKNTYFSEKELKNLFLKNNYSRAEAIKNVSATLEDIIRFDILNYMPGDILVKTDRASMAVGLELRSPYLDVDFASFCISLPSRLKIDGEQDKIILREAYKRDWPEEIVNRKKQGFGAPVSLWLKTPSFIKLKEEYLANNNKKIFKILDFNNCQKISNKNNYQTWILLTLSVWLEKHDLLLSENKS
ncbi:MAG: asparagine synthase C-terminal domain-containing protein, partial [Patescibacteria group bacterium]